jgi:hypothetical protein
MRMTWAMAGSLCCSSGKALERAQADSPGSRAVAAHPKEKDLLFKA